MNKIGKYKGLIFFVLALTGFVFLFHRLLPEAKPLLTARDYKPTEQKIVTYVALGDSLTQGVGDITHQGGFVPLLAQDLQNHYQWQLVTYNHGIGGNTSNQILKRIKQDKELIAAVKEADFMTLTVGGNDVRKVITDNITSLKVSTFKKPAKAYSKRLVKIIKEARKDNPNLPIYVLGIYNPYYLNFPEMTDMQVIIDNWNDTTEKTLDQFDQVYFVPINDLLYQGIDGQEGVGELATSDGKVSNNVLFEGDNFHPNNTGYEIMKQAVMEKIRETKEEWE